MKVKIQLYCTLLIAVTACSARSTAFPTVQTLSTPTLPVISLSATETATATSSPTLTPTPTAIQPPIIEDIKWATYEFPEGVTFEYPSHWFMSPHEDNSVEFIFSYFPGVYAFMSMIDL